MKKRPPFRSIFPGTNQNKQILPSITVLDEFDQFNNSTNEETQDIIFGKKDQKNDSSNTHNNIEEEDYFMEEDVYDYQENDDGQLDREYYQEFNEEESFYSNSLPFENPSNQKYQKSKNIPITSNYNDRTKTNQAANISRSISAEEAVFILESRIESYLSKSLENFSFFFSEKLTGIINSIDKECQANINATIAHLVENFSYEIQEEIKNLIFFKVPFLDINNSKNSFDINSSLSQFQNLYDKIYSFSSQKFTKRNSFSSLSSFQNRIANMTNAISNLYNTKISSFLDEIHNQDNFDQSIIFSKRQIQNRNSQCQTLFNQLESQLYDFDTQINSLKFQKDSIIRQKISFIEAINNIHYSPELLNEIEHNVNKISQNLIQETEKKNNDKSSMYIFENNFEPIIQQLYKIREWNEGMRRGCGINQQHFEFLFKKLLSNQITKATKTINLSSPPIPERRNHSFQSISTYLEEDSQKIKQSENILKSIDSIIDLANKSIQNETLDDLSLNYKSLLC